MRFVIIGGGPGGNTAATVAASLGAEVTLIERDIIGGAAHLWDCIPSKAMVATGGELTELSRANTMGLASRGAPRRPRAARRASRAWRRRCATAVTSLLESQGVRLVRGVGRLTGAYTVDGAAPTRATRSSRPTRSCSRPGRGRACPSGRSVDGERILTTRQAYPPPEIPEHLVVIGSGVTGVEFTHMFSALGSQVTLIVSRQQVLPTKDPEVAAVLEDEFLRRGVKLLKGARATAIGREGDKVFVACDDGRAVDGSHALLAIGSLPNTEGLGCEAAGVEVDDSGYIPGNRHCQTNVPHIYSAGDISGRLPLSSVAAMQGRKIAEHVMGLHSPRAPPPRLRQGRAGDLHRSRDRRGRCRRGRGVRGRSQAPGHEGAVLVEPEVAHQRRRPRLREDPLRSRHGRGARRRDRRPQRRRAHLA